MKYKKSKKCGKRGFRSRVDALIVLANIQAKDSSKRQKTEQRIYLCPMCKNWHLTSTPQRYGNQSTANENLP